MIGKVDKAYLVTTPRTHRRRANSFGVIQSAVRSLIPQRRHASMAPAPDAAPSVKRRTWWVVGVSWYSRPALATGRLGVVSNWGALDGVKEDSASSLRGNHDEGITIECQVNERVLKRQVNKN